MKEVKRKRFEQRNINIENNDMPSKRTLMLPYAGDKGCNLAHSLEKQFRRSFPPEVKLNIIYTGTKLSSNFSLKDQIPFEEKHDVVYKSVCPVENCHHSYVGECGRRIKERIKDHNGRDKNSHLVKHSIESEHSAVDTANFEIIGNSYRHNNKKRRIAEALFVKKLKPSLNVQEKSVPLKLFN
jgi:hypothetical protein